MFKNLQWYLLTHAKEDCIQLTMMGTDQTRICSKTERLCSLYNVQEQVKKKMYREGGTDCGSADGKVLRGNSRG